jgi:hypothetical protein
MQNSGEVLYLRKLFNECRTPEEFNIPFILINFCRQRLKSSMLVAL